MRRLSLGLALAGALSIAASSSDAPAEAPARADAASSSDERFDLVLLHGLTNKQRWSDEFLAACAERWGERRVFLVYTNRHAEDRESVSIRVVRGHELVVGGRNLSSAGDESVARQAAHLGEIVARLQARQGLGRRFSVVAHSMGGLVARRYIADHPDVVSGLVTLGTPHHGSPLANEAKWVGFFAGATEAIVDLQPERCAELNARFPAREARLAAGGRIFTVRGLIEARDSIGSIGELVLGWTLLRAVHGTASDGLVPDESALLEGTTHLADLPGVDHHALVRDPAVARLAADALP